MKTRHWLLAGGILIALVGAVLVFALKDRDAAVIGVELQAFGGVLLVAGLLTIVGVAIASIGAGASGGDKASGSGDSNSVKAIGGLIAVVAGIVVVGALAAFTITRLGSDEKNSAVALASAAFGVISAVIGAYLGIKVTADHNTDLKNADAAKKDADSAKQEADLAQRKLDGMTSQVKEELPPAQADKIMAEAFKAGEETPAPATAG